MIASIIVCTYNRCDDLELCLASLSGQTIPFEEFEVIVVDNNSKDRTREVVHTFHLAHPTMNLRYVLETEQGLSNARNRGIRESQTELDLFLDDDAVVQPDWLEQIVLPFADSRVAAVGGRVELAFPVTPPAWLKGHFLRGYLSEFIPIEDNIYPFDPNRQKLWPVGCNLAFRKEALVLARGFDPELGRKGTQLLGGEETQVLQFLLDKGFAIAIQPRASVDHRVPVNRMKKQYFYKLTEAGPTVSLRFLYSSPFYKVLVYVLRYFVDLLLSVIRFILKLLLFPKPEKFFYSQLKLYRAFCKFRISLKALFKRS